VKRTLLFAFSAVFAGALCAQLPKDAEERFQMKYGRPSPAAEAQQRQAAKTAAQKPAGEFHKADANGDGKITREEWEAHEARKAACKDLCKNTAE